MEGAEISNIFFAGALIFTLLVLVILLFVYTYQGRLMKQKMALQDMEAEQQKKLLEASVMVQEIERQRIARDLHDDVGAILSLIKLQFGQFSGKLPGNLSEEVAKTSANLSEAIQTVRRISHDLLPPTLEHLGLGPALESFFIKIQESHAKQISFKAAGIPYRMTSTNEMHIYRIVHELTQNSIKHAEASEISCVLNYDSNGFVVIFKDNGKGLDQQNLEHLKNKAGLGWKNIQSRLQVMRGDISVIQNSSQGLALRVFVPKPPNQNKNVSN